MSAKQLRTVTTSEAAPQKTILGYLRDDPRIEKGIAAVAGKYFTPERFLSLAVNAVKKTPRLAECDPQSVLGAFMASAALGLEPNTVQQQAFLIPYKRRANVNGKWIDVYECQFQVGYRGFITLAHRSPAIRSIQAEAIHEHDTFEHLVGTNAFLKYQKALKERGDLIGAFSYVRLDGGDEMAVVLPLDEILKIRSKSETYNALVRRIDSAENQKEREKAERSLEETPWVMWFDDMAAKSAIKKHAKQLPLTPGDAINAAAAIDSDSDSNVIDMAAMADPEVVREVVENGYEPPALDENPTQQADFTPRQEQRETEPLNVRTTTTAQAQSRGAAQPEAYLDHKSVLRAIKGAPDREALDVAASSIDDCVPTQQAALLAAQQARLAELDAEANKTSRRPAGNMNME